MSDLSELSYVLLVFGLFVIPRVLQHWRMPRAITALTLLSAFAFTQWPPAAGLLGLQPLHADDWLFAAVAGMLTAAPALLLRPRTSP